MKPTLTTAEKRIYGFGFRCVYQHDHIAQYERGGAHVVELQWRPNGKHVMLSYNKNLFDTKGTGNSCIGLTYGEVIAFAERMKELWG